MGLTVHDLQQFLARYRNTGRLRADAELLMPDGLPITNISVSDDGMAVFFSDDEDEPDDEP